MFSNDWWPFIACVAAMGIFFLSMKYFDFDLIFRMRYRGTGVEAKFQGEIREWRETKKEHSRLCEQMELLGDSITDEIQRRQLQGELNRRAWAVNPEYLANLFKEYQKIEQDARQKDWKAIQAAEKAQKEADKAERYQQQQQLAKAILQQGRFLRTTLIRSQAHEDYKNDRDYPAQSSERRFYEYQGRIYLMELRRYEDVKKPGCWDFSSQSELEAHYYSGSILEFDGAMLTEEDLVFVTDSKSQFRNEELTKLPQRIAA